MRIMPQATSRRNFRVTAADRGRNLSWSTGLDPYNSFLTWWMRTPLVADSPRLATVSKAPLPAEKESKARNRWPWCRRPVESPT